MRPQAAASAAIGNLLVAWYRQGHRDLPWRRAASSGPNPYYVLVSEIMLQQTRAQAVIPYYERFLVRFPTVDVLAKASEEEVLAAWSGLGYYSRARNLWRAAQRVHSLGAFPCEYDAIRELPGVGDYTAAAVASIAFGLPHAVLDGNVLRVVARVENDEADIAAPVTRARFRAVAQGWLDQSTLASRDPGAFNQALMELGATVCLAKNPLCLLCPLATQCEAQAKGTADQLPVKLRRVEPVRIESTAVIVRNRGRVLLRRREAGERRMAGFWELPEPGQLPPGVRPGPVIGRFRHTITHHHYTFSVSEASAVRAVLRRRAAGSFRWFEPHRLSEIPLSTTARKALRLAGIL